MYSRAYESRKVPITRFFRHNVQHPRTKKSTSLSTKYKDSYQPMMTSPMDMHFKRAEVYFEPLRMGKHQSQAEIKRSDIQINNLIINREEERRQSADRDFQLSPQSPIKRGRKTLVLDLDETLIHSSFNPIKNADIILPIEIDGRYCNVYVLKRPGIDEFLQQMSLIYEVVIFTASLSRYAEPLIKRLDKRGFGWQCLFREHCTPHNNSFVKDLARLGRSMKDIIIVDNSPICYLFQPENAIPIESWYEDKDDRQLTNLTPILEKLANVDDVRSEIQEIVKDNKVQYSRAWQLLRQRATSQKNEEIIHSHRGRYVSLETRTPQSNMIETKNTDIKTARISNAKSKVFKKYDKKRSVLKKVIDNKDKSMISKIKKKKIKKYGDENTNPNMNKALHSMYQQIKKRYQNNEHKDSPMNESQQSYYSNCDYSWDGVFTPRGLMSHHYYYDQEDIRISSRGRYYN